MFYTNPYYCSVQLICIKLGTSISYVLLRVAGAGWLAGVLSVAVATAATAAAATAAAAVVAAAATLSLAFLFCQLNSIMQT